MSDLILGLGRSGAGKSTAIQGLDPAKTIVFNTINKRLPFPGSKEAFGKRLRSGNLKDPYEITAEMIKVLKAADKATGISSVVIDDYQYVMALSYAKGKKGGEGWETFDRIFHHATDIFTEAVSLREDLTVFILSHTDERETGIGEKETTMKTVGKAFREKMTPEGFSTILLMAEPDFSDPSEPIYRFRTNGESPAKSPDGMFPFYIPNDYGFVLNRKNEFYDKGTVISESEIVKAAMSKVDTSSDL